MNSTLNDDIIAEALQLCSGSVHDDQYCHWACLFPFLICTDDAKHSLVGFHCSLSSTETKCYKLMYHKVVRKRALQDANLIDYLCFSPNALPLFFSPAGMHSLYGIYLKEEEKVSASLQLLQQLSAAPIMLLTAPFTLLLFLLVAGSNASAVPKQSFTKRDTTTIFDGRTFVNHGLVGFVRVPII